MFSGTPCKLFMYTVILPLIMWCYYIKCRICTLIIVCFQILGVQVLVSHRMLYCSLLNTS